MTLRSLGNIYEGKAMVCIFDARHAKWLPEKHYETIVESIVPEDILDGEVNYAEIQGDELMVEVLMFTL